MDNLVIARKVSDITILEPNGPLQLGEPALDELRRELRDWSNRGGQHLVLDLTAVHVIDSTGVGVLLHGYTSAHNRGGECKLVHPDRMVLEVLRVVGLLRVFAVYDTAQQAIAAFRESCAEMMQA